MRKWLVAVLLAALLLLLGAYSFRNKLLSAALPLLLRQADVQVQLLERLDADWDGLTIERLELAVGPDRAPQRLEKISLEYRLPNITPVRLGIAHANLQIPGGQGDGPPPSFSALLSGLLELPLDSIWIDKLVIS